MLVLSDDIDADENAIGDPRVICITCHAVMRLSDMVPAETSDGQTLHMARTP